MAGDDLPDIIAGARRDAQYFADPADASGGPDAPTSAATRSRTIPNLAAIPTFSWKNNGGVQNGHLYMIPIHRYAPGYTLYRNSEIYDAEIGPNYTPKNADDFKRVLQQLNKPAAGPLGDWRLAEHASSS